MTLPPSGGIFLGKSMVNNAVFHGQNGRPEGLPS
jgi:hypothetical protein